MISNSVCAIARSLETASELYDRFIQTAIQQRLYNIAPEIETRLSLLPNLTLQDKFERVNLLKGWLDSFRPIPPTVVAELKKLYDVRFTYNSNAIEGNTLTQSETALVLATGITIGGKTLREHLEVVGHKDAIDYIEQLVENSNPIGEWEIKQIHNLILRAIAPEEAGCYRQLDVKAAGTDYLYPPHYLVKDLMGDFVTWLNLPETSTQHPIELATEAHLQFVSIHPFRDGNGRAGRLLMNLLLLRAGYPIVVISNDFRQAYIEALVQAQQYGDRSSLLTLILDAATRSLVEMLQILATASESRGRGLPFYTDILTFLNSI